MLYPLKVVDLELSRPLETLENLEGYLGVQGLVRLHGAPIGYVRAPIANGRCTADVLGNLILEQHSWGILTRLLQNGLAASPNPEGLRLEDLYDLPLPECEGELPLVTVAVCTRDRAADLALCLDALVGLDYPNLDLLVVDNAPSSQATQELLQAHYPQVRYVCEPRPGLDWARNRAIIEAKGEILAYTDDDVIVDRGWVKSLAKAFIENPEVMLVTGLVVPYELETESQVLFELYGGFGRGFDRKWNRLYPGSTMFWGWMGTGQFGTGANMAFRRSVFDEIGPFDPALDVGTVTNGGGDLEMFFRVLKEGYTLLYEPNALVRHRHRRDYAKLRVQLSNNSIGFISYCVRSIQAYPEERGSFLRLALWWIVSWNLIRLWVSLKYPTRFPRDLLLAEFLGCWPGLWRYPEARKNAEKIAAEFGEQQPEFQKKEALPPEPPKDRTVAVRKVELSQPVQPLTDITEDSDVQVFVTWKGEPIGSTTIANIYQSVSASRLIEALVNSIGLKLLAPLRNLRKDERWARAVAKLSDRYAPSQTSSNEGLPATIPVSIIVATRDRPEELRACLRSLTALKSPRPVEIIVVDNHPASGLTPPVVAEFAGVTLVSEVRQGLSYARNTGIAASTGEIIIATDDDVTAPEHWLEALVAPFVRSDIAIVTGNVLPLELKTVTQRFFERYGGLGRGFEPFEVNTEWFESFPRKPVPTWDLGATANAAFRAEIFGDPRIGAIDEALGAGTPTGCSEDTYIFYKALKTGYAIAYEPKAYVWHKHRSDMPALRRQIFNYSKGHVAYHLTTLLNDGDLRALYQILINLPAIHIQRIYYWFRGWSDYPLSLILLEMRGNWLGPWALWKSRQRVKLEGRSAPYIPVAERPQTALPEGAASRSAPSLETTPITIGIDAHGS